MKFSKRVWIEYLFVGIIIILAVGVSVFPTIYNSWKTPEFAQYSQAFNFFPDFYHYISFMRQGEEGDIGIITRYTGESFPRKIVLPYIIYPLLGGLGAKLNLNLFTLFTIARVVAGAMRLLAIYVLIAHFFKGRERKLICFVITIFLPSFVHVELINGVAHFTAVLNGITNLDVFRRTVFIPHHLLSNTANITSVIFLYKGLEKNNLKLSFISGVFLLVAALLNPAVILCSLVIYPLAFLLLWVTRFGKKKNLTVHFFAAVFLLILAVFYYKLYMFTTFPWDNLSSDPKGAGRFLRLSNTLWTPIGYIGALGPGALCAFMVILRKRLKKSILYILLLSWFLGPLLAFILLYLFYNQYEIIFRFFQAQQFIPIGLLTSLGIFELFDWLKKKYLICVPLLILLLISIPSYVSSMDKELGEVTPSMYNIYVPKDTLSTFEYLDQNTPRDSVVLGGYFMNQILPSYTHNRVYVGQSDLTYDYDRKMEEFTKIFSNKVAVGEMKSFFVKNKISYVLLGPDTARPEDSFVKRLDFLKLLYRKGDSYIYSVNL